MNASNFSQPSRLFRRITKRGLILVAALGLLAQIIAFAWYRGFIPCFGGEERACLRDALNVWALPSGLTIIASGIDDSSIRRYAFDAEIEFPPQAMAGLLRGRIFTREGWSGGTKSIGCSRTILHYQGFPATEGYSWQSLPGSTPWDRPTLTCTIYLNSTHDRALVQFVAE